MTSETDPYTEWDGAYVLGALGAGERREYEQHLLTCDRCTRSVGELAGLPGVLGLVPAREALATGGVDTGRRDAPTRTDDVPTTPPIALLARRARATRTRRRILAGAAAVALVVAGGSAGAIVATSLRDDPPAVVAAELQAVRLEPVGGSGVEADLTLEPVGWGTRLAWSCTYPPGWSVDGVEYELTLVDRSGQRSTVATWTGDTTQSATGLTAATAWTQDAIARIEMSATTTATPLAAATLDGSR